MLIKFGAEPDDALLKEAVVDGVGQPQACTVGVGCLGRGDRGGCIELAHVSPLMVGVANANAALPFTMPAMTPFSPTAQVQAPKAAQATGGPDGCLTPMPPPLVAGLIIALATSATTVTRSSRAPKYSRVPNHNLVTTNKYDMVLSPIYVDLLRPPRRCAVRGGVP